MIDRLRIFTFFTLLLMSASTFSQELPNLLNNKEVTVISYWDVGDSQTYHCVKEEADYKNGGKKPKKFSNMEFDISVTVKESTDSSYLMEMKYDNFTKGESEAINHANSVLKELSILYVTDELGMFDSIANTKELVVSVNDALTILSADIDSLKIQLLRAMLTKEDNVKVLFLEDILMLHNLNGFGFKLNEGVMFELEYPTFQNIILNGTGIATLNSIDKPRDVCRISMSQEPDLDELKSYLSQIHMMLTGEADAEIDGFNFKSKTRQNYEMELSSGWMTKIRSTTTINISWSRKTMKRVKKYTYSLKS